VENGCASQGISVVNRLSPPLSTAYPHRGHSALVRAESVMDESAEVKSTVLHFRSVYISGCTFLKGQTFKVHDPELDVDVSIQDRPKEEPGYQEYDGLCEVSCARKASERLYADALKTGTLSAKKEMVKQALSDLSKAARRAVEIMRWRHGSPGHTRPIRSSLTSRWSIDGSDWKGVTDNMSGVMTMGPGYKPWSIAIEQSVQELIQNRSSEPIGHDLYREATALEHSNPRSATVLAVAAAEVGFKQFVLTLVADARWLVENLPSPPLAQMLVDFLPTLPVRCRVKGQQPLIPSSLLDEIKKAVKLRNEIVHRGQAPGLKIQTINSVLHTVRDLLYLLDFYSGNQWAFDILSYETRKSLTGK
jgi:hypothetical protein